MNVAALGMCTSSTGLGNDRNMSSRLRGLNLSLVGNVIPRYLDKIITERERELERTALVKVFLGAGAGVEETARKWPKVLHHVLQMDVFGVFPKLVK
jgi:hypothetical protein